MKKKWMSLVLAFSLVATLLAGCGQEASSNTESPDPAPAGESDPGGTQEANAWPTGAVTVYVPAKAGGNNDLVARIFTTNLQDKLGEPFVVVNNMDGNGTVCYDMLRTADPDGLSLMYFTTALNIAHYTGVYEYDVPSNFDYVAGLKAATSSAMVVAADSEFETAEQLAEYIKEHPGEVVCGTQLGASNHLMAVMFEQNAGGVFRHVEAGSTPDKLSALQGGHIDVSFISTNSVGQYVETGDLRVLGLFTSDGQPDSGYPEYPTLYEQGFEDCVFAVDGMFLAPKGTDPELLKCINEEIAATMEDEAVQQQLADVKQTFTFIPYDEMEQYLNDADARIHEVCVAAGLSKE